MRCSFILLYFLSESCASQNEQNESNDSLSFIVFFYYIVVDVDVDVIQFLMGGGVFKIKSPAYRHLYCVSVHGEN